MEPCKTNKIPELETSHRQICVEITMKCWRALVISKRQGSYVYSEPNTLTMLSKKKSYAI